jgi:RHS repeat-associated protein
VVNAENATPGGLGQTFSFIARSYRASSVTSLTNGAGALAQTYTFDSFGKLTNSAGSLTNPFQYTAREFDTETGLYYYRARYYDPAIGRFMSEDPLRFAGDGTNLYSYVKNEPLRNFDPGGLSHRCWGLCGGKCCNKSSQDEWWIDDGVWKRLPAGQCTGTWDDCDGLTCGGGFYYISDLEHGTCKTPGKDCPQWAPRRWTPTHQGSDARAPGGPGGRGSKTGNAPPPGYTWEE